MSLNQLGLGFVFTAKDEATEVIERIKGSFGELEHETDHVTHAAKSSFADFGKGLAIFAAGTAIVGGAFELAEQGDKFIGALEQAGAAANASAEEMEHLREAALGVALKGTGTSAEGAAEALRELVQEGFSANDAATALGPTLSLVAVGFGQISRAQAAGLVNDTLREFRLGAEQAGPLVDKLALAMRSFGIRAAELEPALRGVATGASLTGASLDDTLIAFGLTKSVLPSVEQASRSLNLAFNQLASDHTRKELAAIGVQVSDSSGRMRPLIEILSDLNGRTMRMSEAQREHALASIFSARAGGGLIAIMQALSNGIRDSSGHVVTSTAAIEELRRRMAGATGTASEMKERLLDTFEGQKKGLIGSVQTFLQLIGEPFTEAFKPILSVMRRAFVAVNQFIAAIPEPVKSFLAKVVLVVGSVIALVGAVLAAKAGIALLLVGFKILGITLGGIVATLLPAIAIFAVLALVVAGFAVAFKRDVGGIRTFFENTWERIKLLFRGLAQLFQEGGFSGAVMEELNRAENAGVKKFAIRVFQIVFRIKRFFEGLAEGFGAAIERARPVFEFVGEAIGFVAEQIRDLVSDITGVNDQALEGSSVWKSFGEVVGFVAGAIGSVLAGAIGIVALALRTVIATVRAVIYAFAWLGEFIGETAAKIYLFFTETIPSVFKTVVGAVKSFFQPIVDFITGVVDTIHNVLDKVIAFIGRLVAKIPSRFRPAFLDSVVEAGEAAESRIAERAARAAAPAVRAMVPGVVSEIAAAPLPSPALGVGAAGAALAAVSEVRARGQISDAELDAIVARGIALSEGRPVQAHVTLNVDGETLARASARAERNTAARSFVPVPVPG